MTSPTNLWNSVAVQLSQAHGLSLSENARMFALLNMAIADAGIAVFEAKYHYHLWRPVTAIRAGNMDPNPNTEGDPGFSTFIPTPPYPAYPSGFGGLSNAGSYIVERFFGGNRHTITLTNPALPGVVLQYTKIRQLPTTMPMRASTPESTTALIRRRPRSLAQTWHATSNRTIFDALAPISAEIATRTTTRDALP